MGAILHPMSHVPTTAAGTALGLLITILLHPASASADIYRCTTGDAPPRFSQFPCGEGDTVKIGPMDTVRIPPISEAEQRLLDDLERKRRAERERRARVRARAVREARQRREDRRERCEAARAARAALERQRRKGYSLKEARALDRRDAELEAEERNHC